VKRFADYLRVHKRIRITVLGVSFFIASFALYMGLAVYVFTLGAKAVGDYMRDRLIAECLVALSALVNFETASILTLRGGGFLSRLLFSILVTAGGTILVFGLVVARVILVRNLSAH
jgi:hypothetical protein